MLWKVDSLIPFEQAAKPMLVRTIYTRPGKTDSGIIHLDVHTALRDIVPEESLNTLFTPGGEWNHPTLSMELSADPKLFKQILLEKTKTILNLAPYVCQEMTQLPEIDRGSNHVNKVADSVISIAQLVKASPGDRPLYAKNCDINVVVAAALFHELGLLVDHISPADVSQKLGRALLPEINRNRVYRAMFSRAILLLNPEKFGEAVASCGRDTVHESLEKMRARFGPAALTLTIADCIDVGSHRITECFSDVELSDDLKRSQRVHSQFESKALKLHYRKLQWHIDYYPSPEARLCEGSDQFQAARVDFFSCLQGKLQRLVPSALSLFNGKKTPYIDGFEIVVHDTRNDTVQSQYSVLFERDDFVTTLETLSEQM